MDTRCVASLASRVAASMVREASLSCCFSSFSALSARDTASTSSRDPPLSMAPASMAATLDDARSSRALSSCCLSSVISFVACRICVSSARRAAPSACSCAEALDCASIAVCCACRISSRGASARWSNSYTRACTNSTTVTRSSGVLEMDAYFSALIRNCPKCALDALSRARMSGNSVCMFCSADLSPRTSSRVVACATSTVDL
mmetsp:Transcript_7472/g.12677  ORF Transcript_7472/g.12677 Transcript_7472/m.12677 type:complete len:204 (+) Transcript_7472:1009-1620(+)